MSAKPKGPIVSNLEPLVVTAPDAARMCGMSPAMWQKMKYSGRCPAPMKAGRKDLWAVDVLRAWIAQGMPPAHRFKAEQYRRDAAQLLGNLKKKTAG